MLVVATSKINVVSLSKKELQAQKMIEIAMKIKDKR